MAHRGPRATLDQETRAINDDLLRMQKLVDRSIVRSLDSLVRRDQIVAQQVVDEDVEVNDLRFKIEEACLSLIATQQPAASDLRSVIAAMHMVVEMERMADHATGIAKTVIMMGDEPLLKPLIDIPKMAELAREMLRESLVAYKERNAEKARKVAARDDEMDGLYRAIFEELVEIMSRTPGSATRATYLLWCAHNLERIGDRVTNIAERVVFVNTGDMRELNL
ncbi:MAG: phosphate signaling complex protein PhoU [Chloroflexi bacterium]|nr:phosphate signaling complex protein PhoU [Chloroflexota bacterium]MCH8340916.1 phosphate signaling complex protein PhoU [Chloroflexota bacterium]MCI0773178.1 phosphate signaling complex protein PhoU [Chloroflexota bacterium]MCI0806530.1 phosphate signaling complex protein PhoU [Chloroflexota bacterium]MCI0827514.1 phosphate signaling complex protein PhoU [Chloroflexota bacterium]